MKNKSFAEIKNITAGQQRSNNGMQEISTHGRASRVLQDMIKLIYTVQGV